MILPLKVSVKPANKQLRAVVNPILRTDVFSHALGIEPPDFHAAD
jgi:hypothetical protein